MRTKIGITIVLTVLMVGCEKEENPVDPGERKTDVVMPLAVGNYWSYTDSIFNTNGGFIARDSSRLVITGSASVQAQGAPAEVYFWNWMNLRTGVADDWKWLTRNEPDGRYMYGGVSSKGTTVLGKYLAEKFPVTAGTTWQRVNIVARQDSTFALGDTVQMRCNSVDEPFPTPAGSFKCIVYYYQQTSGTAVRETWLYFAPNVGYVGLVGRLNGITTFRKSLSAYQIR